MRLLLTKMLSQLVFSKLIRNSSKLALKRASFYKYAEIEQLFRVLLIGFELILVFNLQKNFNHQLLLLLLSLYLLLTGTSVLFQSSWTALRRLQREKMCYADILSFTLFLILGADLSHIFYLNFLIVPFCLSLKTGIRRAFPFLLLTFFILITIGAAEAIGNYFQNAGKTLFWSGFVFFIGYFFARWGNSVFLERRKTNFLKRVNRFIKPSTGVNVACDYILTELLDFFAAKSCSILVLGTDEESTLRSIKREGDQTKLDVKVLTERETDRLKTGSLANPVIYWKNEKEEKLFELEDSGWREQKANRIYREIAENSNSFIAVPLLTRSDVFGRVFVFSDREAFTLDDVGFLAQLAEGVTLYLDHLKLSGKISETAAETERHRIALDIHDSIIQPYIALELGLAAMRHKLDERQPVLSRDVDRLIELTRAGIVDLRSYTRGLKNGHGEEIPLFPSIERFVAKFSEATGIEVIFDYKDFVKSVLEGRLSQDLFQMICEGLSNVRKHTGSKRIWLKLAGAGKFISLTIENEGEIVKNEQLFLPKSLAQRAALHGGMVAVIPKAAGGVRIKIEIPVPGVI